MLNSKRKYRECWQKIRNLKKENQMDILKQKKYNIKINTLKGFNFGLDTAAKRMNKLVDQNKLSIIKNEMEKDRQFQRKHKRYVGHRENI